MDIIGNIKAIRLQKSIGQQVIADAMNCDVAVISNIENGKRELRVSELEIISRALGVSTIDLLTYPKRYVEVNSMDSYTPEVTVQIKLKENTKLQVLNLLFGNNEIEILNK